jgi:hypothetical protein
MNTKKDNLNRPDSESYLQSTLAKNAVNSRVRTGRIFSLVMMHFNDNCFYTHRPCTIFAMYLQRMLLFNYCNDRSISKVDCSGERLTCVGKSSGFWNSFSYKMVLKTRKISRGTPYSWPTTWGASWNFTSLYHYIKRKCVSKSWSFSNASQSFSQAIYFNSYH